MNKKLDEKAKNQAEKDSLMPTNKNLYEYDGFDSAIKKAEVKQNYDLKSVSDAQIDEINSSNKLINKISIASSIAKNLS